MTSFYFLTLKTYASAPRFRSYCRRPALLAPSLGVVGTSRSSVRIARPTMTTDEDNVGSFGLKEMDNRRTESGEGLPRPTAYVLADGGFVGVHVWFDEFPPRRYHFLIIYQISWLVDTRRNLNRVGAKQQISANILAIYTVWHVYSHCSWSFVNPVNSLTLKTYASASRFRSYVTKNLRC